MTLLNKQLEPTIENDVMTFHYLFLRTEFDDLMSFGEAANSHSGQFSPLHEISRGFI